MIVELECMLHHQVKSCNAQNKERIVNNNIKAKEFKATL